MAASMLVSKALVWGRSLAWIAASNPAGGVDVCGECCVVTSGGCMTDRSLVHGSSCDYVFAVGCDAIQLQPCTPTESR